MDGQDQDSVAGGGTRDANFAGEDKSRSHTRDGASPGKIFVGGLARETTSAQFTEHFEKYGELTDSVIMKDRKTGQPRGFGFVTYADPSAVDQVIQDTHIINGKQVEIKRTTPRGAAGSKEVKTRKIFVGGIPATVNEDEFKEFFSQYGEVIEHQIMLDRATNRSRGFGFITFGAEQAVDELLAKGNRLEFAGSQVEIKKAEPKKPNAPQPSSKRHNDSKPPYGGGFGNPYNSFGGSAVGASGPYRPTGAYGGRAGYGGYGGGAYGGYGGANIGAYRGQASAYLGGSYGGGGFGRGYDSGAGPVGPGGGYGRYVGGSGGGSGGGYGGGYDAGGLGGGVGGGSGGPFYGGRGGYGGPGGGRYHPYGRH